MRASTTEEIAAQHTQAQQRIDEGMPCAKREFLGAISLNDKMRPTYLLPANELQEEKKEDLSVLSSLLDNPRCFTTRGAVDVSKLQDLVREGYNSKYETTDKPGESQGSSPPHVASTTNYWDPQNAAANNVAITRPSHDAWGILKIVLLFCDDFATRIYQLPWWNHFEEALQPVLEACVPPGATLIRVLFASMPPGVTIPVHHDTGEWVKTTHRVHVPILVNDPSKVLFRCGPTVDAMQRIDCEPGHVFEINNQAKHAVSNCDSDSRVHLILDYLDNGPVRERIRLDPGETLVQTRRSIDRLKDLQERPTPSYIILGAQKAGTTSLYDYINQHPWVIAARRRETHCLDWRWKDDLETPEEQLEYCRKFFFTEELKLHPSCLTGDSTPSYLLDSRRVIPRIQQVFPWDMKFFCIFRDPVKRAISHYAMVTSSNGTPAQLKTRGMEWRQKSFRKVVMDELEIMKSCGLIPYWNEVDGTVDETIFASFSDSPEEDQAWDQYLANHVPLSTGSYGLLTRGMYALQLRPWFRAFEKDRFLLLKLEDLRTKGVEDFMRPVWAHLDLPNFPVEDDTAKNTRGYQPMGQDIQDYLQRFFEPHNRRLKDLLEHRTEGTWNNPWLHKD